MHHRIGIRGFVRLLVCPLVRPLVWRSVGQILVKTLSPFLQKCDLQTDEPMDRPKDGQTLLYRCDDASKNSQSREEFGVITPNYGKLIFHHCEGFDEEAAIQITFYLEK